jgi:hypothetical protein
MDTKIVANVVVSDYDSLRSAVEYTSSLVKKGISVSLYFNNIIDAMLMPDITEEYYFKGDLVSKAFAEEMGYLGVKIVKVLGDTVEWLSTLWTEEVASKVDLIYSHADTGIQRYYVSNNST